MLIVTVHVLGLALVQLMEDEESLLDGLQFSHLLNLFQETQEHFLVEKETAAAYIVLLVNHLILHLPNTFSTQLVTGLLKVVCGDWDGVVAKDIFNNFELSADAFDLETLVNVMFVSFIFHTFNLSILEVVLVEVLHLWEDHLVTEDLHAEAFFNIKVTPEVLRHLLEED